MNQLQQGVEKFIATHASHIHVKDGYGDTQYYVYSVDVDDLRSWMAGHVRVPVEPTDAMLVAARDWSHQKYGEPIDNDDARGCWEAMINAIKGEGK